MRVWVLAALSGCNWIYGLDETRIRDGGPTQFFDAPADAPFGCPAGEPMFKLALRQVPVASCIAYVPSYDSGKAFAQCKQLGIAQGDVDAAMASVDLDSKLSEPRLFPEGDRAFARDRNAGTLELLVRDGEAWTTAGTVLSTPAGNWSISNPTRGPDRRAIVIMLDAPSMQYQLVELAEDTGWKPRDSYVLSAGFGDHPSLTSDGLHLVFDAATAGVYYGARPDRDARFTTFTKLSTVPLQGQFPFLRDDCGLLYFSALDTVFALQQR